MLHRVPHLFNNALGMILCIRDITSAPRVIPAQAGFLLSAPRAIAAPLCPSGETPLLWCPTWVMVLCSNRQGTDAKPSSHTGITQPAFLLPLFEHRTWGCQLLDALPGVDLHHEAFAIVFFTTLPCDLVCTRDQLQVPLISRNTIVALWCVRGCGVLRSYANSSQRMDWELLAVFLCGYVSIVAIFSVKDTPTIPMAGSSTTARWSPLRWTISSSGRSAFQPPSSAISA
ncbi:hypothetical protein CCHOA_00640 [Corynebacterium choanae]|uniref:Uncharacterized protein n=1 Tax=Corynebacterium choanae TaxID=1862358 RepID=A0A3G6J3G6_9CORY|nr:hypothetical protein CCHOA_00640 [Corynebacterium choanae]